MTTPAPGKVGLIVNPMSGRDVRRYVARARRELPEDKRSQVERAVVGAAALGARHFVAARDCFRISESALEHLELGIEIEWIAGSIDTQPADTARFTRAMRDAGCGALLVLGGDGTSRIVATAWPEAPIVALSTGTNNAFPVSCEPTLAGAALGLVASGALPLEAVARRAKLVHARFADGREEIAVIDLALLRNDDSGSLLPLDPANVAECFLARAEPAAIGLSPLGGLLLPCSSGDDFGVLVRCDATAPKRQLLVAMSPGLFQRAPIRDVQKLALGETRVVRGPGIIACDGDRLRELAPDEPVEICVRRDGPFVIDVPRALQLAAEARLFENRELPGPGCRLDHQHGPGCC
jgi:hypothetical protein